MNLARVLSGLRSASRITELPRARAATRDWLRLVAAYAGISKLEYPYRIALRDGTVITIEAFTDLATFWLIFFSKTYMVYDTDLRIIDAGANVGMFTTYAARRSPHAHIASIEPFSTTFERLRTAIADNQIGNRVTAFRAALQGVDGTVGFDGRPGVPSQFRAVTPNGAPVQAISLQSIIDACEWDRVDLLKLDIEGSEYEALLNTSRPILKKIARISMEYHPRPDDKSLVPERIFAHLHECGFELILHRPDPGGYGLAHLVRTG
jgi:FkbM family methyltransferase